MSNDSPTDPTSSSQLDGTLEVSQKVWENSPANPFNWPEDRKWRLALVVAAVTLLIGLNATSITTPSLVIAEKFHVSDHHFPHSFWPVTVWNTGAAIGPMVGLPLLENFGIRTGYLVHGHQTSHARA